MVDLAEHLFVHTCTIERRTLGATDGAGHAALGAWAAAHTGVICRLDDRVGQRRSGRTNVVIAHPVLFLETGTDLLPTDRITNIRYADGSVLAEGAFRIVDPWDPAGEADHLEVALEKA